ncbi:MAG: VOC family protein [Leptospiraceae bacterium]|nr:VOC family protein [Leptospiraceae bacterium]
MKQTISFFTIGVRDLKLMSKFYMEVFEWKPMKDDYEGILFFQMKGLIFALFPEDELAADIGTVSDGKGFKRFTCAINFKSEAEVDEKFNQLVSKGAKILKSPEKVYWGGYRGYIADPEDNYWELAYNPFIELED